MTIQKALKDGELLVTLEGRLDTTTAPELEKALASEDVQKLAFDFSKLEYISSAGLRVMLASHKRMSTRGGMVIRHANEMITEVFELTGFTDILNIE